jgi:hypothetical protein
MGIARSVFSTATGNHAPSHLGIFVMQKLVLQKLVAAWIKAPTLANAIKIRDHANKHPMSILMLDANGIAQVHEAVVSIGESK